MERENYNERKYLGIGETMVFTQQESNSLKFALSGFSNTNIYSFRQSLLHMGALILCFLYIL